MGIPRALVACPFFVVVKVGLPSTLNRFTPSGSFPSAEQRSNPNDMRESKQVMVSQRVMVKPKPIDRERHEQRDRHSICDEERVTPLKHVLDA